jgi:multiple sugar transport system permease protein
MTVARSIRLLLAAISVLVVVWAFMDVGARIVRKWKLEHQRPITLTILHWGDPAENRIVQDLVDRYMADNPQVRIVRIHASDMRPKLKTMMAAGAAPDLFYLPPDLLPELAQLKLILPIDNFVAADRARNPGWFEDYFPVLIDAYRYDVEKQQTGSGALFGLPKDFSTAVFYVNVDLFERAGIDLKRIQDNGWTWEEFEDAARRITQLGELPEFRQQGRTIFGAVFELWPDTIRQILWTFGGDFFGYRPDGSADFRDVTLDSEASQEALQMIVRTRIKDRTVFNATGIAKDGAQEFVNGNIGMAGPVGRWKVPRFASSDMKFRWDVVPCPYKSPEFEASQIFMTAWTISASTRHPEEAYRLMKFLCGPIGARMQSELGLAIPPLQSVARSPSFLSPAGIPPHRADLFLRPVDRGKARIQQIPREAEWTRIVGDNITLAIQLTEQTTLENARAIKAAWLDELDSPLRRREWPAMRWDVVGWIAGLAILAGVAAFWWSARREHLGPLDRAQQRSGYLFVVPWIAGFLALTAGPMVVSLLLSFTRWSALTPMRDAEAVGLANYVQLVTRDPTFWQSLKVTGYFMLLSVPITQVAALAVALLMNLRLRGITVFRTIFFVPSVVGLVAMSMLALQVFNNDYGILNRLLAPILGLFGATPPDWFGKDARTWAIPGFVLIGLWGVGGGMILYLAGLKGIPASLYEAAKIDGAGAWRRLWNVTLPQLSPLIFYNLVMGIIGSFQVFTQAYIMTGAGPGNSTLFYVLQLYRQAFEFHNMGYASAIAWILFVLCLLVTLLVFRGSRNLVYYEGLKT